MNEITVAPFDPTTIPADGVAVWTTLAEVQDIWDMQDAETLLGRMKVARRVIARHYGAAKLSVAKAIVVSQEHHWSKS